MAAQSWNKMGRLSRDSDGRVSVASLSTNGIIIEGPKDKLRCWGVFGWVGGTDDVEGAAHIKKYNRELLEWELDVEGSKLGHHQNTLMGQSTDKEKRVTVSLSEDEFKDLSAKDKSAIFQYEPMTTDGGAESTQTWRKLLPGEYGRVASWTGVFRYLRVDEECA